MKVLWTIAITTVLYIGHCTADLCGNTCEAEEVCLDIMNGTCVNRSELVSCDYSSFCYKGQKCCKSHEYCIPENAECCGVGYCEENHECCGMKKCCWPGDHCFVNTCIRGGQPGPLPTKSARSTPKTRMSVSTKTTTRPTSKTRTSVSRTTTTRIVFQWWYGVIAGVVLLTALAAIVFCQRKRKTRRPNEAAANGQTGQAPPYNMQPDAVFFVSQPRQV